MPEPDPTERLVVAMAVECIHGFEAGLCDVCFPKQAAAPKRTAVVRPPRASASLRVERGGRSAGSISKSTLANIAAARVFHVTHLRNLEQILQNGLMLSAQLDGHGVGGAKPPVDLSSRLTRELRATAEIRPGLTVAQCVPFFLSPNAALWNELRDGAVHSTRWSDVARAAASTDFVMLVSTIGALGATSVLTDDDAAGTLTRFAAQPEDRARLFARLSTEQIARAEVLAPGSVELGAVQLIGVANDPVRDRVREMIAAVVRAVPQNNTDVTRIKVAVYPPWFQSS